MGWGGVIDEFKSEPRISRISADMKESSGLKSAVRFVSLSADHGSGPLRLLPIFNPSSFIRGNPRNPRLIFRIGKLVNERFLSMSRGTEIGPIALT